jgi:hypothetical protein
MYSNTWSMQWWFVNFQRLEQPYSCQMKLLGLLTWLGLALVATYSFPREMLHVPGICKFLKSPLCLWLHLHSFTQYPHRGFL